MKLNGGYFPGPAFDHLLFLVFGVQFVLDIRFERIGAGQVFGHAPWRFSKFDHLVGAENAEDQQAQVDETQVSFREPVVDFRELHPRQNIEKDIGQVKRFFGGQAKTLDRPYGTVAAMTINKNVPSIPQPSKILTIRFRIIKTPTVSMSPTEMMSGRI